MPLEYDSGMTATEVSREAAWDQYQRERNLYAKGVGPRGPKFMPLKRWKKDMNISDKPVMLQKIEALPALTQARVLTELQNDPRQVAHIKMLLAEPDPAAAIIKDQEKVALNVVKPGLYPEAKGRWPVYREYFGRAYGIAVKRAAQAKTAQVAGLGAGRLSWKEIYGLGGNRLPWQSFYGIDGLGAEGQKEVVQAATSIVKGEKKEEDWNALLKTASSLAMQYGVPALQSNVKAYAQKKEGKQEGKLATKAMKEIEKQAGKQAEKDAVESAKAEQIAAQEQAAPLTSPEPPKGMTKTTKVGLGVGALLLAGFVGYMALRKQK